MICGDCGFEDSVVQSPIPYLKFINWVLSSTASLTNWVVLYQNAYFLMINLLASSLQCCTGSSAGIFLFLIFFLALIISSLALSFFYRIFPLTESRCHWLTIYYQSLRRTITLKTLIKPALISTTSVAINFLYLIFFYLWYWHYT